MLKHLCLVILISLNLQLAFADPLTHHLTVKTSCGDVDFEIHARANEGAFVDKVASILHADVPKMIEYFQYAPRDTVHFVSYELAREANGSAQAMPYNRIVLYPVPPFGDSQLTYTSDWIRILVVHELTHVLHMDQTAGFFAFLRFLLGGYGKLSGVTPIWFLEGVAVWSESQFSGAGRLGNEMMEYEYLSTLVNQDYCYTLGCVDNPGVYPYGSYPYWVGAYFISYLEQHKPGTIRCLLKENANNFPGFWNMTFNDCLGSGAAQLYWEFRKETLSKLKREAHLADLARVDFKPDGGIVWSRGFRPVDGKLYLIERNRTL